MRKRGRYSRCSRSRGFGRALHERVHMKKRTDTTGLSFAVHTECAMSVDIGNEWERRCMSLDESNENMYVMRTRAENGSHTVYHNTGCRRPALKIETEPTGRYCSLIREKDDDQPVSLFNW